MTKAIIRAAKLAAPIFAEQEWTWGMDHHVPSEGEIALSLMRLVESMRPESTWVRSGRFVIFRTEDDLVIALKLSMIENDAAPPPK